MKPNSRHVRWLTAIAAVTVIAGCTPTLYGYERVRDSDKYISDAVRKEIVAQGLSRAQVIEQLGLPDGTNDEARTIGYSRCIRSSGWGAFGPGNVDSCQRAIFWFDEKGRAFAQRSSIAKCGYDKTCFGRPFAQWLADPPPSEERD
jgi:hypothetical protein